MKTAAGKFFRRHIVSYIRSAAQFESNVRQSKIPVLVDFKAEWCGPCKLLTPKLLDLENTHSSKFNLAILDIDIPENDKIVAEFKIQAVPTIVAIDNGKETSRLTGLQSEDVLDDLISKLC